jgi:hypothetical protein
MSKGSKRRPSFVSNNIFNDNWNKIFRKTDVHADIQNKQSNLNSNSVISNINNISSSNCNKCEDIPNL